MIPKDKRLWVMGWFAITNQELHNTTEPIASIAVSNEIILIMLCSAAKRYPSSMIAIVHRSLIQARMASILVH